MNNSLRGVLWSGLIFPGLGQVVLKHYRRGAAIALVVLVSMVVVVVQAVQQALAILEKIAVDGGEISMSAIARAATEASTGSGSLSIKLLLLLIMVLWILSVVDAYAIGRKIDSEQRILSQSSS